MNSSSTLRRNISIKHTKRNPCSSRCPPNKSFDCYCAKETVSSETLYIENEK